MILISEKIDVETFIDNIFKEAKEIDDITQIGLSDIQLAQIDIIVENEEKYKGVFTVLISSLFYKCLHPEQDIRYHKIKIDKNKSYAGRVFDEKYVTPFLKKNNFSGATSSTGWLTASLSEDSPYTKEYTGNIGSKKIKNIFLEIFADVEERNSDYELFLKALLKHSYDENKNRNVSLIRPIDNESDNTIDEILGYLDQHFYFYQNQNKSSYGASLLPVIAIYSMYELQMDEFKRFSNKELSSLSSHTSADIHTNNAGDIDILDENEDLYEVVEVKFDKIIDYMTVWDCYQKIKTSTIQRYFILSTFKIKKEDEDNIKELINKTKREHGCQIIINGIFDTLERLLRCFENPDLFLERYLFNLESNREVKYIHKKSWNEITNKENL